MTFRIRPGRPGPPGATLLDGAVRFCLPSVHGTRVELCLYDPDTEQEIFRADLPGRDGAWWHGEVEGAGPGTLYGYRVRGPWAPEAGHRFDPSKLLIDPWAKAWSRGIRYGAALYPGPPGAAPDGRDTADLVPKAVVQGPDGFDWEDDERPATPWCETVIYEAHPRGLTRLHPGVPEGARGTLLALSDPAMLAHYRRIGITALELLPIAAYADERFLIDRGLRNWWGYQTVGPMAPDPRLGGESLRQDLKTVVKALHREGIEVILDVVFNHTGEGDDGGPTLALRGIDNAGFYRLDGQGRYLNYAGTGNTLDLTNPVALQLVMDSLRHWATEYRVDGFRFDLGVTLAREAPGFDANGGFLRALRQDPVLAPLKLIMEPWDLGPGGYRLGAFPPPVAEWNDRFRDGVRRFWRGDSGAAAEFARRLAGSADAFDHGLRAPWAGVNFLACHDGFTLQDTVSYRKKHNHANGEGNRDGHGENYSDNLGAEGATRDPAIRAARAARVRAMLATLVFAQGTPMLAAGDEFGNSQGGNNNAYAQDNPVGWLDWLGADAALIEEVARLLRLRRDWPLLRQSRFLHGEEGPDGRTLVWRRADGAEMTVADWHDPELRCLGMEIRAAVGTEGGQGALYLLFNAGAETAIVLPDGPWRCLYDSAGAERPGRLAAQSVRLMADTRERQT